MGRPKSAHTIESLQLNVAAALEGKTWLLLPDGQQDIGSARYYPLPTALAELQQLSLIPVRSHKKDSGCIYLRRVKGELAKRNMRRTSATVNIARGEGRVKQAGIRFDRELRDQRAKIAEVVAGVQAEAAKAVAGLNDLFALGRQGLDGQMRAHLAGEQWQGEVISAAAFRDCFRMVTQAVKGLGLPSDQRERAAEAIMEEAANALRQTQEAIASGEGDATVADEAPKAEEGLLN